MRRITPDDEALCCGERLEVEDLTPADGRTKAAGRAKHHKRLAGESTEADGSDDEIIEAVAVDVPGRGDRVASKVSPRSSLDDEALGRGERGQVHDLTPADAGAEAAARAEHHVRFTGVP